MGINHLCENAHFTYKIFQYTCFNCTCYTCSHDKCVWDMSKYNKLSDIQYARFQILPGTSILNCFGQLVSPPCFPSDWTNIVNLSGELVSSIEQNKFPQWFFNRFDQVSFKYWQRDLLVAIHLLTTVKEAIWVIYLRFDSQQPQTM